MPDEPSNIVPFDPSAEVDRLLRQRLRKLKDDRWAFMRERMPVKMAILIALMEPADEVIADARDGFKNAPAEDDQKPSAMLALGRTIVANALTGNTAAQALILDRLDGKVSKVAVEDETDGSSQAREADRARVLGDVVRQLTDARRKSE